MSSVAADTVGAPRVASDAGPQARPRDHCAVPRAAAASASATPATAWSATSAGSARAGLTILPFLLLGVALLIALGFEFVNGFHDTANAVATVIYTHSLPPHFAVAVLRAR